MTNASEILLYIFRSLLTFFWRAQRCERPRNLHHIAKHIPCEFTRHSFRWMLMNCYFISRGARLKRGDGNPPFEFRENNYKWWIVKHHVSSCDITLRVSYWHRCDRCFWDCLKNDNCSVSVFHLPLLKNLLKISKASESRSENWELQVTGVRSLL